MDKFLLRPAKRARGDGDVAPAEFDPPGVIVSWNCNSLRMRVDRREIGEVRLEDGGMMQHAWIACVALHARVAPRHAHCLQQPSRSVHCAGAHVLAPDYVPLLSHACTLMMPRASGNAAMCVSACHTTSTQSTHVCARPIVVAQLQQWQHSWGKGRRPSCYRKSG